MKKAKIILKRVIAFLILGIIVCVSFVVVHNKNIEKTKEEANTIIDITNKVFELNQIYEKDNPTVIDEQLKECDKILEELHQENLSGRVKGDTLKNIMDNSIALVECHKKALNCFSSTANFVGTSNAFDYYSKYCDEEDTYKAQIKSDIERLSTK